MRCPVCDTEIYNGLKICPACGNQIAVEYQQTNYQQTNSQQQYQPHVEQQQYSQPVQPVQIYIDTNNYADTSQNKTIPALGASIVSLIFAILSFVTFCIVPVAVVCASVGLFSGLIAIIVSSAKGRKNGFAVAGIVCSLLFFLAYGVFLLLGISISELM